MQFSYSCTFEGAEMELTCHDGTVRDLIFIESSINRSTILVSGGAGNCHLNVTDCNTGQLIQSMKGHTGSCMIVHLMLKISVTKFHILNCTVKTMIYHKTFSTLFHSFREDEKVQKSGSLGLRRLKLLFQRENPIFGCSIAKESDSTWGIQKSGWCLSF